ncbi:MAG TPA: DUF4876 domain-containing protein [Candidatus Alistipes intestinipullorum]|nr:DUF4876 domain-containing protein [Candidatus Alistipes intestinipullorum]
MKKLTIYLLALLSAACTSFERDPYGDSVRTLDVTVVYPEAYADFLRAGVDVTLSDRNSGNVYTSQTNAQGAAEFRVSAGHYRLSVLDMASDEAVFNGSVELVDLSKESRSLSVELGFSKPGTIIIKEIYSGGCPEDPPATGKYTDDKYIILHNNSFETQYLDGLCFATVAPYNSSTANNPWISTDPTGNIVFREYAAIPDCIWQFPGSGTDFPLAPGEDAVIAYYGVDHTATYSQSVNLNRKGYFVLYDLLLYPGNTTHPTPAPGDQIDEAHYMKVLKKTGKSSAIVYVISNDSPAIIIFRAPDGYDLEGYLATMESEILLSSITYSKVPWEWVIDGVEVVDKTGASRTKRLRTDIDAGAVEFSAMSQGHTLHRRLNEATTASAGIDIYYDTNNSSNDFYERETQSLREEL